MDWSSDRTKPWFDWSEDATQFSRVENVARSSSVALHAINNEMKVPQTFRVCIVPGSFIRFSLSGPRRLRPCLVLERLPPQVLHGEVLQGEAHSVAHLGDRRVAGTVRVEPAAQPHLDQTSGPVKSDCLLIHSSTLLDMKTRFEVDPARRALWAARDQPRTLFLWPA